MNGSNLISKFYAQKQKLLRNSLADFSQSLNLFPKIGIELEFYLRANSKPVSLDIFIKQLQKILPQIVVEKEQGHLQIEIKTAPTLDIFALAQEIENIKSAAINLAQSMEFFADFSAQPFAQDCGSALQINISLQDEQNKNLFTNKDEIFFYTIAGVLDLLDESMILCAPKSEDYLRYDLEINRALHKNGKYSAPVNICFGENNRSAAIRIPHCQDKTQNRIEFRLASANADPYLLLSAMMVMMKYGIEQKKRPDDSLKIFGNAFDAQYNLRKFSQNLEMAQNIFQNSNLKREFELILSRQD